MDLLKFLIVENINKKLMNYSNDIDKILKSELTILIDKARAKVFPFNKKIIEEFYKEYKKLLLVTN